MNFFVFDVYCRILAVLSNLSFWTLFFLRVTNAMSYSYWWLLAPGFIALFLILVGVCLTVLHYKLHPEDYQLDLTLYKLHNKHS